MHSPAANTTAIVDHPRRPDQSADLDTARLGLQAAWERLAPLVDEARRLDTQVSENPRLLADPEVSAFTRWLQIFSRELGAAQTVYQAAQAKAQVPLDELWKARSASEKLYDFIQEGQRIALAQRADQDSPDLSDDSNGAPDQPPG